MRILVVGGGGREHALVWKLSQSPLVDAIYCAPGNPGIAEKASCLPIGAEDLKGLLNLAQEQHIDLTVIGPEAPLVAGIADLFAQYGLKVFGPSQAGARLEGSKIWAKEFMEKYGIPTARARWFDEADVAKAYVEELGVPLVIKADGLAAGKGVTVAGTLAEARAAIENCLEKESFGAAGKRVIVEEFLDGQEVSILAFTDGRTMVPMVPSQDHKRAFDGDQGPNTGGMGAYSPPPAYTADMARRVESEILQPTLEGLAAEGIDYRGVLYAGLMITSQGPKVLEFNVRFGDPETQPVLLRLESDLAEIMVAVAEGRLGEVASRISWSDRASACVVLASGGYPGPYTTGYPITGLDQLPPGVLAFHAGTKRVDGRLVTAGGRVLGVSALGPTVAEALDKVYQAIPKIYFQDMHYRHDVGWRAEYQGCRAQASGGAPAPDGRNGDPGAGNGQAGTGMRLTPERQPLSFKLGGPN